MSTTEYSRQKFSVPPPAPGSFGRCRRTPIPAEKLSTNKNGLRSVHNSPDYPSRQLTSAQVIQVAVAVSAVGEEEVAVEVCFNFLLFSSPVISHALHLVFVNQAEEIMGDAVGGVVVVLGAEGEYEVFSFFHQSLVFFHTRSFYQAVEFKDAVVPREVGAARAGVPVVEDVEVPEEAQKPLSNPTGIPAFSSRRPRRACWSLKTSFPGSPSTAKNESLSRVPSPIPRSNTGCGILSVASLLLVFSVVWTTSLSPQARRCCILALQVARVLATLLTSSDRCVFHVRFRYLQRIWLKLVRIPGRCRLCC